MILLQFAKLVYFFASTNNDPTFSFQSTNKSGVWRRSSLYPNKQDAAVVGDVNGDGTVTSADITALYDYLLDNDMTFYGTSDLNNDGSVTSADITVIYNILLGTQ